MIRILLARGILFLTVVTVLFTACVLIGPRWAPARVALRYATGYHKECTLQQSLDAVRTSYREFQRIEELQSEMRLISSDAEFGLELWETPMGRLWIPAGSLGALRQDIAEQERRIYGDDSNGVRPGDIVLDCGANIGLYSKEALRLGAATVVAIEPAPQNLESLRRNLKEEIVGGRVIVYPKGVWDREDFLVLHVDATNQAANSVVIVRPNAKPSVRVPLTTIDKLVKDLSLERVDFIKMDIEGAERQAVAGARNTLAKHKPRLALSVYHLEDDSRVLPALVQKVVPEYRTECKCHDSDSPWGIQPQVIRFY